MRGGETYAEIYSLLSAYARLPFFIGSIAAVGYVSLLLPDKLVLTRSLLIIAGGVTAAAGLILCAVSGRGGQSRFDFFSARR